MTEIPLATAVQLHPDDNVICVLRDHKAGEIPVWAGPQAPRLSVPVPLGHKVALQEIETGAIVRKYGSPIGRATKPIAAGDHVHLHNLRGLSADQKDESAET